MNTLEVLKNTRRLLTKDAWVKGIWALTGDNETACDPNELWAEQWCLLGAVSRIMNETPFCWSYETINLCRMFINEMADEWKYHPASPEDVIISWNDATIRTHEDVLELLDVVIAKLELQSTPVTYLNHKEQVFEDA